MTFRVFLYCLTCFFFLSIHSLSLAQQKMNGLSFVASSEPAKEVHAASVKSMNANWTALMPFAVMKNQSSPVLSHDQDRQWYGETEAGIKQYHRLLKTAGIQSMLKPQIWIRDGKFTGRIHMQSPEDWLAFERSYTDFILRYARLAALEQIPVFCIGTELKSFVRARPAYWKALIKKIRSVFKGQLTYAANWDEFEETPFWTALDFIGIDAYFPLTPVQDPSKEVLQKAWKPHFTAIENMALQCEIPVLFTEYGYRSVDYVGAKPWVVDRNKKPVNLAAQSRALEVLVNEFWPQDWFAGGFVWKWFMFLDRAGGPQDNRYTPQNKPAAKVLAKAYEPYLVKS